MSPIIESPSCRDLSTAIPCNTLETYIGSRPQKFLPVDTCTRHFHNTSEYYIGSKSQKFPSTDGFPQKFPTTTINYSANASDYDIGSSPKNFLPSTSCSLNSTKKAYLTFPLLHGSKPFCHIQHSRDR